MKKNSVAQNPTMIFVCEHGAAKSIIAAAYFNKFMRERNFNTQSVARGTNPDQEISPKTIEGLRRDGSTPTESSPKKLTLEDMESVERIVSFCEIPEEFQQGAIIELWHDIPLVSENYEKARNAILVKLEELLKK